MPFSHAGSHSFPLVTVNLGWLMMSTELGSTQSSTPYSVTVPLSLHLTPGFQAYGVRDGSFSKEGKKIPVPLSAKAQLWC